MGKKIEPGFFIDAYGKEHPDVAKKVKAGKKECPFLNTGIKGLTKRFRSKELPVKVPSELFKER